MHNVLITGFKSDAEAQEFIAWFEGSAEQFTDIWFELQENEGIRDAIMCNIKKTYPLHTDEHGNHIMDVSDSD